MAEFEKQSDDKLQPIEEERQGLMFLETPTQASTQHIMTPESMIKPGFKTPGVKGKNVLRFNTDLDLETIESLSNKGSSNEK